MKVLRNPDRSLLPLWSKTAIQKVGGPAVLESIVTARGPPGGRSGGFARRKWQLVSNTFGGQVAIRFSSGYTGGLLSSLGGVRLRSLMNIRTVYWFNLLIAESESIILLIQSWIRLSSSHAELTSPGKSRWWCWTVVRRPPDCICIPAVFSMYYSDVLYHMIHLRMEFKSSPTL